MSYTETSNPVDIEKLADIKYIDYGMAIAHNMPCCIYPDNEPAVLDCSKGVFTPSWTARRDGWALVQYNKDAGWFYRWIFKMIRNRVFKYTDQK